jgi:hypothetical protein
MAPKKTETTAASEASGAAPGVFGTLTEGEMKFIKIMFDNMSTRPDADWDKVAADVGLKDAKCAKERFRQMSVKHGWRDGTTATPRKPKAAAGATPGTACTTPSKVSKAKTPRKTPVKKNAKSKAKADSDEEAGNSQQLVDASAVAVAPEDVAEDSIQAKENADVGEGKIEVAASGQ